MTSPQLVILSCLFFWNMGLQLGSLRATVTEIYIPTSRPLYKMTVSLSSLCRFLIGCWGSFSLIWLSCVGGEIYLKVLIETVLNDREIQKVVWTPNSCVLSNHSILKEINLFFWSLFCSAGKCLLCSVDLRFKMILNQCLCFDACMCTSSVFCLVLHARMASLLYTWRPRRITWRWCGSFWRTTPARVLPPR